MNEKQYYIQEISFKKSWNFLFPLLGFKQYEKYNPENTYLYATEIDASIDDFNLLVFYKTEETEDFKKFEREQILTKETLIACFQVEDGILYVFDMIKNANTVMKFMEGSYSKFDYPIKQKILAYFGDQFNKKAEPGRVIHMALFNELYKKAVSEELDIAEESLNELVDKYNLEDEIFHGKIIENKNCCEEKTLYLDTL